MSVTKMEQELTRKLDELKMTGLLKDHEMVISGFNVPFKSVTSRS